MTARWTATATLLLALVQGVPHAADASLVRPLPVPPSGIVAPTASAPTAPAMPLPAVKQPVAAAQPTGTTAATTTPIATMGPKWPVSFNLLEGEREGWGFVVGAPGAIDVRVQSQGAPIVVSLRRPDGYMVEQTGSGDIGVTVQSTAADVARGVLWSVTVRGANAAPPAPPALGGKREFRPVARGTITVAHPPGDARRAESEIKALTQQAQARVAQAPSQTNQSSAAALVAKRRAEIDQQTVARQAQMLERLRTSIPAEAYQRASARIAARRTTDTAAIGPQARQQAAQFLATQAPPGGTPAQSAGALVPIAGDPTITSVSVNEGQPGDPVLIAGTSLGDQAGEVHFIVANGIDLIAPAMHWSGTQAFVSVPEKSGVLAFNGLVYIVAAGGKKSAGTAFGFRPAIDVQSIPIAFDPQSARLGSPYDSIDARHVYVGHQVMNVTAVLCFCGQKGDDEVHLHGESLKNGWQVDGVDVWYDHSNYTPGAVSIVDFRPGTASKYVQFHWWFGWNGFVFYRATFIVSGPKGLPPE